MTPNIVGRPRRRVDARAKVTGQTRFADDIMLPRTLHGRLLRSPHPHARILGVDTSAAATLPGVHLVLTGRAMDAQEALVHGIVSRVVDREDLDTTAREMAERVASTPAVTVKMARRVIRHLSEPQVRSSMAEELIAQTFINKSDDYAEFRAAKAEDRAPRYTGS